MNVLKHTKKIILVIVIIMLFNFCCPKVVRAGTDVMEKAFKLLVELFFGIFQEIQDIINRLFTDTR